MDNTGLIYGLDKVKFNEELLGFIEEDSFDFGGAKGEVTEIKAAQIKGFPIKVIPKSNGTIKPTFDLIQMDYDTMAAIMGGAVVKTGEKTTGWNAPSKLVMVTGKLTIDTDSGQRITIPKCLVSGYIGGNLNLTSVSKIKMEISIIDPGDGSQPFSITDIPAEAPQTPEEASQNG